MKAYQNKLILVTGATGYLGKAVCHHLLSQGYRLRVVVRSLDTIWPEHVDVFNIMGIEQSTNWEGALENVSTIIHCAARVHILNDSSASPLEEFRKVNALATINLAKQAERACVKKFIFISSIGVNGTETSHRPFYADDKPWPDTPYAVSKWEAEQALIKLSNETKLKYVIIRPPLIYGPNAPGNFAKLLDAINSYYPIPLGRVNNLRSFVALDNVVDLIATCIDHPKADNQIFLVSDNEDLSTADFIRKIAKARNKAAFILPLPQNWLELVARLTGKEKQVRKLTASLQVNIDKTLTRLSWQPKVSVDLAITQATKAESSI